MSDYDSNCRDLADHFLAETVCTDVDHEELAQDIQDAVESWFREWERKNVPPPGGSRRHNLAAQVKTLGADSLLPDWKPKRKSA